MDILNLTFKSGEKAKASEMNQVVAKINEAAATMATKSWVNQQGFLESKDISNLATKNNPTLTGTVTLPKSVTINELNSRAGLLKYDEGELKVDTNTYAPVVGGKIPSQYIPDGAGFNKVKLSLSEYRSLAVKDPNTMYLIINIDIDAESEDI